MLNKKTWKWFEIRLYNYPLSLLPNKKTRTMSNLKESIRKSLVLSGFCMISSLAMSAQISLTLENKSTRDVIREIEKVSEYRFFYNDDLHGLDQIISIKINGANIQTILNEIQRQTSIHYVIK